MSATAFSAIVDQQVNYAAGSVLASNVRLLVVDDEPEIAESLAELLKRKEGYDVTIARNGQEAMAILEASLVESSQAIDLVLLDVRMPVMTGPEVLAWLRNHPELQFTRVIVLTAASGNEEKVEALSAGADDYITKPYYPLELIARVKTILRTQQLEKQLQSQSQQLVALNRVSSAVSAKLSTAEVLAVATDGIETIFDVELAAAFMIDDNRALLHCRQVQSAEYKIAANNWPPVPVGRGIIGTSYRLGQSLCLDDPLADGRFQPGLDAPLDFPIRSLMVTPLVVRGKPVGIVAAINKGDGLFTEIESDLFTSLASSVSRAVEIAWLFQSIRQRQLELLESRNTLQAVIDGILHPIYTIDENWRIVAVNRTKCREIGKTPDDLVGKTCFQVFFNRENPCDHCKTASTLDNERSQRWTVSWQGSDHRRDEWDVSAYPIPGSKADSARAVIVWQDRTEERQLESSLMQAGKLAAIGQLAAGVAHEINNPLTAINANAEILEMSISPDDDNYESVELIGRAGIRAAKVVRGLLDFARQSQYEFEVADINDSIRQALSLVTYQMTTAGIDVSIELADDLPPADVSLEHLQSVWLNLLLNARDALQVKSKDKQIEILTRHDIGTDDILVIVRDTGRGMSPTELVRIFEPFFTTKAPGEGTGLGLATCHRIVEQHRGRIDVSSIEGEGTTFAVHLPVKGQAAN